MKVIAWRILLTLLIPFWAVLTLLVMVGEFAKDIFNSAYGFVYEKSGKPFDTKEVQK